MTNGVRVTDIWIRDSDVSHEFARNRVASHSFALFRRGVTSPCAPSDPSHPDGGSNQSLPVTVLS